MYRLLTVLLIALLLLPQGAGAAVFALTASPAGCIDDGEISCCCIPDAAPTGPALQRGCCCEVAPEEAPAPEPAQASWLGGPTADGCDPQAPATSAVPAVSAAETCQELRPTPPRAPPRAALAGRFVLRC